MRGRRRFKASEISQTTIYRGTITLDDLRKAFHIPNGATVTVNVPGGGDWSGSSLDIDADTLINVQWEVVRR